MGKTTNCNLYKEKYDVYCGRGKGKFNDPIECTPGDYGWLGNPVSIGKQCPMCNHIHSDNGSTLPCYKQYLLRRLEKEISNSFYLIFWVRW